MVNYGGAAKEWFEQADAKTAGCTILVNGLTKAAAKIG